MLAIAEVAWARSPLTDSTDVRISNIEEAENSIAVSPLDPDVLLVSNIMSDGTGRVSGWISLDGGKTWSNFPVAAPPLSNNGDPSCAISTFQAPGSQYGRFLIAHNDDGPQACAQKDSPDSAWTDVTVDNQFGIDKPNIWVDNQSSLSGYPRVYDAYTVVSPAGISVSKSEDNGDSWTLTSPIPFSVNPEERWSPVVRTNASGHVYVAWANNSDANRNAASSIGFAASVDQGSNWSEEMQISGDIIGFDGLHPLDAGKTMPAATYPSMAVDRVTGDIYVVWAQRGQSPDRAELGFVRGTPTSNPLVFNWSQPAPITQSPTGDQWHPWIAWDACTGMLAVVFHDSRANNSRAETWAAVSSDQGANWTEFKISDADGSGDWPATTGIEYIGLDAADGKAFPVWSDDRDVYQDYRPYISPFLLWGIEQSTVSHTIEQLPGLVFRLTVTWTTNLRADDGDTLVLTPPSGIPLDGTFTYTISADGKSHTAVYEATCRPSPGSWTYVCKSTRSACSSPRLSDAKSFKVMNCLN